MILYHIGILLVTIYYSKQSSYYGVMSYTTNPDNSTSSVIQVLEIALACGVSHPYSLLARLSRQDFQSGPCAEASCRPTPANSRRDLKIEDFTLRRAYLNGNEATQHTT